MFHYEKMFEPFTADGATLEMSITWLKKATNADDRIIQQAIAETMNIVAQGETFPLPCPCGCEMTNVHTPINHFMLSRVIDLQNQADILFRTLIEDAQKALVESQLKQLSDFEKEYYKMRYGTWWDKLKKFMGMRYESWDMEKNHFRNILDKDEK